MKSRFRELTVKVKSTKFISTLLFVIMSLGVLFLVFMYNFVEYEFDIKKLDDPAWWSNYIMTICFGFMFLFVSLTNTKTKLMNEPLIKDDKRDLKLLKETLILRNEYQNFVDYVAVRNKEEKFKIYKEHMLRKIDKARHEKDIEKYRALIKEAEENKDMIRVYGYKNITTAIIFHGLDRKSKKQFEYSGREGFGEKVISSVIINIIVHAIILATSFVALKNNANSYAHVVSILILFISYSIKGARYATYSVNEVLSGVLQTRKAFVLEYLIKNGYEVTLPSGGACAVKGGENQ